MARDATDQVCTTPLLSVGTPRIEHVARPAVGPDGERNGPFVGMSWIVARPHALPVVSLDAQAVVYWVGEESAASPIPYYGREVVVSYVAPDERDRTFRLLGQDELLSALPRGESPTPRALRLSEERLHDLEARVQERVSLTNAWLSARHWAPMSVCLGDGSTKPMRAGALRVALAPLSDLGTTAITIHHEDGRLLARLEDGPTDCRGEQRLVAVAVAVEQQVAVAEVAEAATDSCAAPNRVYLFNLGKAVPEAPSAPLVCQYGQALTADERASELRRYERSDLAVFRLNPAEPLNLRAGPGIRAPVVAKLPFLSEGLRYVGGACRADGALWLEVEYGERRGWVNEHFVSPVAAFEDVAAIGETPISDFAAPTLALLGQRLRRALSREHSRAAEMPIDVELVGQNQRPGYGQLVLFLIPIGGDFSGVEYVAHAVLDAGLWRLEALQQRYICDRGSHEGSCV